MEELEDVSLCDLPLLSSTKPKRSQKKQQQPPNDAVFHSPEDFAFGFEAGEMCVADEVFFQGQILPLHPNPSKKSTRSGSTEPNPSNGFKSIFVGTSRSTDWPESGSGKVNTVMITRASSDLSSRVDSTNPTRHSLSRDLVRCGSMDRYPSPETEFKSMVSTSRTTTHQEPGMGGGKPVKITRVSSDPSSCSTSTNLTRLNYTRNLTRSGSMDRVHSRITARPETGLDKQLNLSQKLTRPGTTNPNPVTGLTSRNKTHLDSRLTTRVSYESRTRTRNQFHTHPSPKPQLRASSTSYYRENSSNARLERARSVKTKQKSSVWDFFRLGLVRTPEIEIQEIRANILRRSSSCRIPNKTRAPASEGSANSGDEWKKTTAFLSGSCKCSAVDSDAIVAKSKANSDDRNYIDAGSEKVRLLMEAKDGVVLSDWSESREERKDKKQSLRDGEGRRRKQPQALNRRTCEWLKQLSHAKAVAMHV